MYFDQSKVIYTTSNYYASVIITSIEFLCKGNEVCNDALSHTISNVWLHKLNVNLKTYIPNNYVLQRYDQKLLLLFPT